MRQKDKTTGKDISSCQSGGRSRRNRRIVDLALPVKKVIRRKWLFCVYICYPSGGYGVGVSACLKKPFDSLLDEADEAFQNKYKSRKYEDQGRNACAAKPDQPSFSV